ncbi:hypothetical protein DL768_005450 [Monosporascus sp. mg162]|nr:hypothetical protein DL768_005450 [Monosporascus sp. mg162]
MDDPTTNSPNPTNATNMDGTDLVPQVPEKPTPIVTELKVEKLKSPVVRPSAQSRSSMNGPLYMQTSNNRVIIRRVKRKEDGLMRGLARWLLDNQTGFSFNLIALIFLAHFLLPKARQYTLKFFALSYYNPDTGLYGIGWDDFYFIAFCIILFTGLRAFFMEHVLGPLAKHWGVAKKGDVTRFSEQAWLLIYYSVFWPLGMYIYHISPYYLNMEELWTNWPIRETSGIMKVYLLPQWAFWLQQVLVIHIEERRKDHWQMLIHHFVTVTLIASCYAYHHTRVGNLILVLMDVVDLFLPLAKCLKYTGFTTLCDAMFGVFMLSWFLARHVFYLIVCYSIYQDTPRIIPHGCFHGPAGNLTGPFPPPDKWGHLIDPLREPAVGTVCYTDAVRRGFLSCLLFLQAITIFWFVMIVKVAIRVLNGAGAEDIRSDDEEDDGKLEEDDYEYEEAQPFEEEVGVEAIDLKGWERRTGVRRAATSSGVSLPGHSDRKELLGRIGCEKQVD